MTILTTTQIIPNGGQRTSVDSTLMSISASHTGIQPAFASRHSTPADCLTTAATAITNACACGALAGNHHGGASTSQRGASSSTRESHLRKFFDKVTKDKCAEFSGARDGDRFLEAVMCYDDKLDLLYRLVNIEVGGTCVWVCVHDGWLARV